MTPDQLTKMIEAATSGGLVSPWKDNTEAPSFRTLDGHEVISSVFSDGCHIAVLEADAELLCFLRNSAELFRDLWVAASFQLECQQISSSGARTCMITPYDYEKIQAVLKKLSEQD